MQNLIGLTAIDGSARQLTFDRLFKSHPSWAAALTTRAVTSTSPSAGAIDPLVLTS